MKSFFKAGAAQVDVTPPLGTMINGDFVTHYAQRIHDNLFAKALVLQNEQTAIAIVVVDICAMQKDLIDRVKNKIAAALPVASSNILICSTHTHYGGSVADLLLGHADLPYSRKLEAGIVEAVQQAFKKLRPAKIAHGHFDVPEHVVGRRFFMKKEFTAALNPVTGQQDTVKTNPFGYEHLIEKRSSAVDTGFHFIAVKGLDDKWISVLANYSMHYVGDCRNGTITADYFGQFAQALTSRLNAGDEMVAILSNGTSGEASIWDFINPDRYPTGEFEKSKFIGNDLAERLTNSLHSIQWEQNVPLGVLYDEVTVNTRKPNPQEVATAKSIVAETEYENLQMFEGMKPNDDALRRLYAREQVFLSEYADSFSFAVQAIRIGSGTIGALGGEFFAETGTWLKKNTHSNNYFTICLANDFVGYVPPAHEIKRGGYETWRCRTSFLAEDAEDIIRNHLFSLLRQLV
jgi:neutral ceramidase